MPSIVPASWLLGMICVGDALRWPGRIAKERTWTNMVAVFVGLGLVIGCDWLPGHGNGPEEQTAGEKSRRKKSMHSWPTNETLYAVNPDYQPVFFYVKAPVHYVSHVKNLPQDATTFLFELKTNRKH